MNWFPRDPTQAVRAGIALALVTSLSCVVTYLVSDQFSNARMARRLAGELRQARHDLAEAVESRERIEGNLYRALVDDAQAAVALRAPGWRWYTLDRIRQTTGLRTSQRDLAVVRTTAVAAMLEPATFGVGVLTGHTGAVRSIACSPDGQRIATGSADGSVRLWEALTGKAMDIVYEAGSPVNAVCYAPRGARLAVACDDGVVRIWRTGRDVAPQELSDGDAKLLAVAFAPDGSTLAAGDETGVVVIWEVASGEVVRHLNVAAPASALAFSPDGKQVAVAAGDRPVSLWEASRGLMLEPCVGHAAPVTAVAFRGDGAVIVSAASDGTVRTWDAATSSASSAWPTSGGGVHSLALRPGSDQAVIGSADGGLRLLNLTTGAERLLAKEHAGPVSSVAFSPDGGILLSGSADKTVRIYAVAGGTERSDYLAHFGDVLSLDFNPPKEGGIRSFPTLPGEAGLRADEEWLASGSADATVALARLSRGGCDAPFAHGVVLAAAYSPDGRQAAVGCKDHHVIAIWDLERRRVARVLWGHTGPVLAVAWGPDGRTIASGSEDRTVRIWNAESGTAGPVLRGHTDTINSVAFSPGGTWLASGSFDSTVKVWPVSSSGSDIEPLTLRGHGGFVLCVAWSPDAELLASASADHFIKLWKLDRRARKGPPPSAAGVIAPIEAREIGSLPDHTSHVFSVAFSPDGALLASGSNDRSMRLWDVATRRQLASVPAHSAKVLSVAFHPNGELVASSAEDGTVRVWDVRGVRSLVGGAKVSAGGTGRVAPAVQLRAEIQRHSMGVPALKFSPEGDMLLTGSWDRTLRLWSVSEFAAATMASTSVQPLATLGGYTAPGWPDTATRLVTRFASGVVLAAAISPDGKRLATGCKEPNVVALWDLETRELVRLMHGHTHDVMSVAWRPDGRVLASASEDETVRLWDVHSGEQLAVLRGHSGKVNAVAFSPHGRWLASGAFDRTIRIWEVTDRAQPEDLANEGGDQTHSNRNQIRHHHLPLSPNGGGRGEVVVRDLGHVEGHAGWVLGLAFSPDGRTLASSSADGMVRLWRLSGASEGATPTLSEQARWAGHTGLVYAVAFSPDGKLVASAGEDRTVRIWELESGSARHVAVAHTDRVYSIAFSPDGRILASGSHDCDVRLWDAESGETVQVLSGHRSAVAAVAFHPDGQWLVTGSWDRTVRVWDVSSADLAASLGGPTGRVSSVAFVQSGQAVASVSLDGTARRHSVDLASVVSDGLPAVAKSPVVVRSGACAALRVARRTVLISALDGGQFAVWDPESGEQLCSLAGSESPLAAIAGSIAGNRLAIGFLDGSIQVYDVPDRSNLAATDAPRQPLHTITAHFGPVRVLAFAPDAALLASSSADAAIKLWHVPAGNGAGELAGPVGALAFGPDGNLLAAAGEDGVVRLWDAAKRELVLSLPRDGRPLRALAFSANGKILAAAGAGRVVSVWHLSTLRGQLAELGLDW